MPTCNVEVGLSCVRVLWLLMPCHNMNEGKYPRRYACPKYESN